MNVEKQIVEYIGSQSDGKRIDMETLHLFMQKLMPHCKLWFFDGKNSDGKVVSNPNVGYGAYHIKYTDGTSKEFYQVGFSGNTTGISIYIMGIENKKHLSETYGKTLGKANISGYCIKFKALKDIDMEVLKASIQDGLEATK